MIGILSFLLIILVTIVINQIAASLLEKTGVKRERATLEALSAWTTCGFTTAESEGMVSQPVRRHIIMSLMFFGHTGLAAAGATLILGFIKQDEAHNHLSVKLPLLLVGLTLLGIMKNSNWLSTLTTAVSPAILKYLNRKEHTDQIRELSPLPAGYILAEIFIQEENAACGTLLADLPFDRYHLKLLGLIDPNDNFIRDKNFPEILQENYKLVTFGLSQDIEEFRQAISSTVSDD
jgi:hypothetical protein